VAKLKKKLFENSIETSISKAKQSTKPQEILLIFIILQK